MFDVIEHLFEPRAVLQALASALGPGGMLVISTPNIDSASRYLLGPDWAVLSPLEHVYYFSEDSLRRLLEATGFAQVVSCASTSSWGPQETINFRYTHAPAGGRAPANGSCAPAGRRWRGAAARRPSGRAAVFRATALSP